MKKSMTNPISKQRGLTMISWVVVATFLLFQGVIAMNVIPVYLNDSSVKTIMKDLPSDATAIRSNPRELKSMIVQRLSINNIYSIKASDIKVKKGRRELIVTIEYEPRGKLIGTLDYIVSFKHEAVVKSR